MTRTPSAPHTSRISARSASSFTPTVSRISTSRNYATRDLLFHNVGGMRFEDVSLVSGAAYSASGTEQSGTGSAAGDFDGDGDLDLLVTNFQRDYNTLFLNQTPPGDRCGSPTKPPRPG